MVAVGAASSICWMRCTWLAKLETMTRPVVLRKTVSMAGASSPSEIVKPGTSALVESTRKRSTPSSPSRAKARRSVIRPSSGNWSILKSPCAEHEAGGGADGHGQAVGDGVVDGDELAVEGAELLAVALGHDPTVTGLMRCSTSLASRKASVRREPTTGMSGRSRSR